MASGQIKILSKLIIVKKMNIYLAIQEILPVYKEIYN